jgi:hypothetical protein
MKKALLLFFSLLLFGLTMHAQEKLLMIQQRIEFISEQEESENVDLSDMMDLLSQYFEKPLNLNKVSKEELQSLGLLSIFQIQDLLLHLRENGQLISIYELQSLRYWDTETIQRILPFVRVADRLDNLHLSFREALNSAQIESYFRYQRSLESRKAYEGPLDSTSNQFYHGNPDKYYTRFRWKYRTNLSVGVTAEKDAGETFGFRNGQNGFDFYSAHAYYNGGKYLQTVAVGDYHIQIGQGLNMWTGYGVGKSSMVMLTKKAAPSIRPYTSADENRYLRGTAVQIGYENLSLSCFASRKNIDGTPLESHDTLDGHEFAFSSINFSGLHRTNSEIERKNVIGEQIFGSYLQYQNLNFKLGLASTYLSFSGDYSKSLQSYNLFDFRGKSLMTSSLDYSFSMWNFHFFGEASYQGETKAHAVLNGVLISLDPSLSFSLLHRSYSKAYYSHYVSAFSEGTEPQNEEGIFAGIDWRLAKRWTVKAYADYFQSKWLRYQVDGPSSGNEYLAQLTYKASRKQEVYFRYRRQNKMKNSRDSDGSISNLEEVVQQNYRFNFSYGFAEGYTWRSRIEHVTINRLSNTPEAGWLIYQDLILKPKGKSLELTLRYALFDTDSYDSRIYAYESNALYVFAVPAHYYQGSRAYVLIRYDFWKRCSLWARYAVNVYANRKSIGTGPEEISGSRKSDLTLQLRVKF